MRSLFLKIFLWFWLAMALVAMVLIISIEISRQNEFTPPERVLMDKALRLHGRLAADQYLRGGAPALEDYLSQLKSTGELYPALFDDQARLLGGSLTSVPAEDWIRQTLNSTGPQVAFANSGPRVALPVETGGGHHFVFVSDLVFAPKSFFRTQPHKLVLMFLAILITAGLVCYWLASYLTAPVTQLRMATLKLAGGNLAARANLKGRRRDELTGLGHDFNRMAERIESMMESQKRLLSDISHELRSPLARLSVALGLVRQKSPPESNEMLNRIERETERLNELIGRLLTLFRLESQEAGGDFKPVDLAALIREVAADANYEAVNRNRQVQIKQLSPCTIIGRPELLHSAIENVVRNGLHYTQAGTAVEISLERNLEGHALVRIRDHGPGVPETVLGKLFQPFYRIDDARDRQAGGAGLGLAITKRAVQLHGGTATASNAADGGLTVELQLPCKSGEREATPGSSRR
jgi:signal transduction histidine kinase